MVAGDAEQGTVGFQREKRGVGAPTCMDAPVRRGGQCRLASFGQEAAYTK